MVDTAKIVDLFERLDFRVLLIRKAVQEYVFDEEEMRFSLGDTSVEDLDGEGDTEEITVEFAVKSIEIPDSCNRFDNKDSDGVPFRQFDWSLDWDDDSHKQDFFEILKANGLTEKEARRFMEITNLSYPEHLLMKVYEAPVEEFLTHSDKQVRQFGLQEKSLEE